VEVKVPNSEDDRLKRIEAIEAALRRTQAPEVAGAPGGAFVSAETGGEVPDPFAVKERGPLGIAAEVGAGLAAEKGAERVALARGMSRPGKAALATGAVALASAGARGLEEVITGGPDAFDDVGKVMFKAGAENASGSAMGRLTTGAARGALSGLSNVKYIDAQITPRTREMMDDVNKQLREYYEKTAGVKISGEKRSWYNPMRYMLGSGTELDNTDAVERLQAKGLDPWTARGIAVNGGATLADLSDNSGYRWLQTLVTQTAPGAVVMGKFKNNRARMLQGTISDLGAAFGKALTPEELTVAINDGLRGRFNTLESARMIGVNGLKQYLPPNWMYQPRFLRGLDPRNPADQVLLKAGDGPWTLDEFNQTRSAIGAMAHDPDSVQRDRARELATKMDKLLMRKLPDKASRTLYRDWIGADDEAHKGALDRAFVEGMWVNNIKGNEAAIAEKMLKDGNTLNYARLERALGKNSPALQSFKGAIIERITSRATDIGTSGNPVLHPERMRLQLTNQSGLGAEYLEMIEPGLSKRYATYADALERFNQAQKAGGGMLATVGQVGGVGAAVSGYMSPVQLGLMLASPVYVARAMRNPDTASLITRLAGAARTADQNPKLVGRLTGRLLEKLPFEMPTAGQQAVEDLKTGKNPISTGNFMVDAMVNPVGALANMQPGR
jgi:hypothetical protein